MNLSYQGRMRQYFSSILPQKAPASNGDAVLTQLRIHNLKYLGFGQLTKKDGLPFSCNPSELVKFYLEGKLAMNVTRLSNLISKDLEARLESTGRTFCQKIKNTGRRAHEDCFVKHYPTTGMDINEIMSQINEFEKKDLEIQANLEKALRIRQAQPLELTPDILIVRKARPSLKQYPTIPRPVWGKTGSPPKKFKLLVVESFDKDQKHLQSLDHDGKYSIPHSKLVQAIFRIFAPPGATSKIVQYNPGKTFQGLLNRLQTFDAMNVSMAATEFSSTAWRDAKALEQIAKRKPTFVATANDGCQARNTFLTEHARGVQSSDHTGQLMKYSGPNNNHPESTTALGEYYVQPVFQDNQLKGFSLLNDGQIDIPLTEKSLVVDSSKPDLLPEDSQHPFRQWGTSLAAPKEAAAYSAKLYNTRCV